MLKRTLYNNILLFVWCNTCLAVADEVRDSVQLPDIEISTTRYARPPQQMQQQVSILNPMMLRERHILSPKDITAYIPNLLMPDYGSAMTSSVYVRGLGSRIDQPVVGIVVDGVPLLDKNMYDHHTTDIRRIEFLRGPQGTMYGRNTSGGLLEIHTLQPLDVSSVHVRAEVGYSTANTVQAAASVYVPHTSDFGYGISARYGRTDGFYTNTYSGKKVDAGQDVNARWVMDWQPDDHWRVTNTVTFDWVQQGAFPYASVESNRIAYNDETSYRRWVLRDGLKALYQRDGYKLQIVGSYQFLGDRMLMDQDYTIAPIFTLKQKQRIHGGTIDALLFAPQHMAWYEWQVGVSAFAKQNTMSAPVTFLRQGIEDLILKNANQGIRTIFGNDSIEIANSTLPIEDDFSFLNAGVAAYHQSVFHLGKWSISLGLRLDYESAMMHYDAYADLDYRFTYNMAQPKRLHSAMQGTRQSHYINILPRVAVSYDWQRVTLYAYGAEGYKAGGYNPQIFSTIMQNQLMHDLPNDMGIHLLIEDERFRKVDITSYKPEKTWTAEIGMHSHPVDGLSLNADAFFIYCRDQQVTVFPDGKTTGRMMANAAQSRIWGVETDIYYQWQHQRWRGMLQAAYGFTDARFVRFDDGKGRYNGNHIPYSPSHTAHLTAQVAYSVRKKWLQHISVGVHADGIGEIWWNETNSLKQPFYASLGANLELAWQWFTVQFYGKNLTDTHYDVFYFLSMEKDYVQHGKPREMGVNLMFNL